MTNEQIGLIFSIFGMCATVASFQMKGKRRFLLLQTVGNLLFLVSYFFADAGIAVILNVIFITRNLLFMILGERADAHAKPIGFSLIGAIVLSYVLYSAFAGETLSANLWNLLPIVGSIFGTAAVMQKNETTLRVWKSGDSISWLAFNIHVGLAALGGTLGEVLNLSSLVISVIRLRKAKKTEKPSV